MHLEAESSRQKLEIELDSLRKLQLDTNNKAEQLQGSLYNSERSVSKLKLIY
jgi:hypothetical protein